MTLAFQPRPKQRAVVSYLGGRMGVSAVPGSGKTWTLSALAAKLVAEADLADDQEVLIVTLVNSAVNNFSSRVGGFVQARGLLPGVGYRVRTLHGLAHDVVRERPGLVGLSDDFSIVDERLSREILLDAAQAWVRENTDVADAFLSSDLEPYRAERLLNGRWPDLVVDVATALIKQAKDLQITPAGLRYLLDNFPDALPLLEMGYSVYADYQRALSYRGAVDFDDLIRLALQALRLDPAFLGRLRQRWPYILEDEAQDSSRLQELILRELVGHEGNWVRVGDPNQAIYETFTTASPKYLRNFLEEPGVVAADLPNSGRSMQSVIDLANALIDWTMADHPEPSLRSALTMPYIQPTPPGDPQPNPPDDPDQVRFVDRAYSPKDEIEAVAHSAAAWVEAHPEQTVAVLVPRNNRGFELSNRLKEMGTPHVELLRSAPATREAAGALGNVLNYLGDPASARKLGTVYRVWRRDDRESEELWKEAEAISKLIERCPRVEDFVWPRLGRDWLASLEDHALWSPDLGEHLSTFRSLVRRWQGTTVLPIDQIILTLAQDFFDDPVDLAIAHKLALVLRQTADAHPDWRLPELTEELAVVARNERRFLGFADADIGFDPEVYRGQVVVTTMHRAKGLEWDKVYLMSVNDYNFPSAQPQDQYISEPWFVRDQLNLQAEALAQLKALETNPDLFDYDEGTPTLDARLEYAAERLRLFYVGITRARKALSVTWNTGRRGNAQPSVPFIALQTWWEQA
ncbi:MAG: ATP-dependent helicase [Anaerolineae bacterium]|nr:ATP-dependent helicase [Anaerolineae bacterium]